MEQLDSWVNERMSFVVSLYASLEIHEVIEKFFQEVQRTSSCDGLEYTHEEIDKHIMLGAPFASVLAYPLQNAEQELGTLKLCKQTEFTDKEKDFIEETISLLLAPLNNAINYQRALLQALIDPLTGLANRFSLENALQREMDIAHRQHQPLSILMLDIDYFKKINDQAGHLAGDYYLKTFSTKLSELCRESDLIFRVSGEEFLIILTNTPHEGASQLAKRILDGIRHLHCDYKNHTLSTTVSIGITTEYESVADIAQLLEAVDTALYLAKRRGRNQAIHFSEQMA